MGAVQKIYKSLRLKYHRFKFYTEINWFKTLYFNYKKFPFSIAKKLPVFFYGKVKLQDVSGEIIINAPIKRAMIGFGQPYEKTTVHNGTAEIVLSGKIVFNGHVQFGKDYFIYVGKDAYAEFGHMASMATNAKIICTKKVVFGNYARIGSESQVIDTNFHPMLDTVTGEKFKMNAPICLGNYNYIGNRVSIMKGTVTPDYFTIASNSLCSKNYLYLGKNVMVGGMPAKLLRENISRDWEFEKDLLDKWLII